MKSSYIIILFVIGVLLHISCNDDMDRLPITDASEDNAFTTYENFASFMYPCYGLFFNAQIRTNFHESGQSSMEVGDFWGGYLTRKEGTESPFRSQNVTTEGSDLWNFAQVRRINMMLSHVDDGYLSESEANHWRAIGYFFHSWFYMHLMDNFGDVPWVTRVLSEDDPEGYGKRTNRYQVADSIFSRLQWAESHIGDFSSQDGANTINKHCVQAVLSRFALREGTWRKYHAAPEYRKYLEECVRVSKELMDDYPSLYAGSKIDASTSLASGYGELWTTENLSSIPGIILYQEYNEAAVKMHTASQYQHANYGNADVPQHIIDMFLMKNGKPISNSASNYEGGAGKNMYDEFRNRDHRLYQNVMPPYRVTITRSEFTSGNNGYNNNTKWDFRTDANSARDREYIDLMGINADAINGGVGMKRLPSQNWSGSVLAGCPNTQNSSQAQYIRSGSGYYAWKHYTHWQVHTNSFSNTQDKPIFKIEEILLNYAEATFELGIFDQNACDISINRLRARVGTAGMNVGEIDANWDTNRDKGNNSWWTGNYEDYEVQPLLWEIRRERMMELFAEGFAWYDVRRWAKAPYYINRQPYGMYVHADNREGYVVKYTGSYIDLATGNSVNINDREGGYIFTYGKAPGWLDTYYLLPIPPSEIVINPNLAPQNPGY